MATDDALAPGFACSDECGCEHCLRLSEALTAAEQERDQAQEQIDRLADYIMLAVPGEPSQSQGAVDTAIRLLTRLAALEQAARAWRDTKSEAAWEALGDALTALDALPPEQP